LEFRRFVGSAVDFIADFEGLEDWVAEKLRILDWKQMAKVAQKVQRNHSKESWPKYAG
jgi:hypothetical protein